MLMSSEWNVEAAVALWYQSQEEETEEQGEEMDDEPSAAYPPLASTGHTAGSMTGDRTLGGDPPSSQPASSSQPINRKPQSGMKTLQDLQKESSGRHGHGHDDDDDHGQDMFAGGEKSGLAVENPGQNPRDLMERLLQRAREYVPSVFFFFRFLLRSSCFICTPIMLTLNAVMHHAPVTTTMNPTVHTLRVVESLLVVKVLNLGSSKIPTRTARALSLLLIALSIFGAMASVSTMAHYTIATTPQTKQSCSNSCKVAPPSTF